MKNVFNEANISQCGKLIFAQSPGFDLDTFITIATDDIENRELKDRANQICLALTTCLPNDFLSALDVLLSTLLPVSDNQEIGGLDTTEQGVAGWLILPYSQFVGENGLSHIDESMSALKQMTKRFSSEFGIRYIFLAQPKQALDIVSQWTNDNCHHVRRLVSEGCRPLLPWAMQLPLFKNEPTQIIPLLESLKFDSSEYVQRSVANNLNDIAKHHPQLVVDVVSNWTNSAPDKSKKDTQKMVKHACRSLIKQAYPPALALFGFADSQGLNAHLEVTPKILHLGESLTLTAKVENPSDIDMKILVDFVIHHQKANGSTSPKVFKWGEYVIPAKSFKVLEKSHGIKKITTRKYYPGMHHVELQINGQRFSPASFELQMPDVKL